MFSFQGTWLNFLRNSMKHHFHGVSVNLLSFFVYLPIESPAQRVSIGEDKSICGQVLMLASIRTAQSELGRSGGPKWTRTTDLTIISRVL